ncbi:putative endo-beta-1,4-glucanase D [Colletotrichum shisoi]|uniref:lytic cellulose monooxygenase (C4-dehydrogenating) n=1 Tax=Colletotrichum shisoi TaxID=2078593 RepID=A0A5Q4BUK4_9PEZI|nr:putative endo-beta-1,4-glucanase D [Colletotrichum shisoi]
MKLSAVVLAAFAPLVSAHYFFDTLIVDGKATKSFECVRSNTRQAKYNPTKWENVRDDMTPDLPDFRCNKGAFTFAAKTGTLEVKLGISATIKHPGPAIVYMSKAPSTAKAYEGDGDWCHELEHTNTVEFTVPKDTPNGEYLIRVAHIGVTVPTLARPSSTTREGCAQVKITGGGNGTPGPMIKFPGGYKKSSDPSFNFSIYNGYKAYPMPGPAVWTSGSSSSVNETEAESTTTPVSGNNNNNNADEEDCKKKSVRRSRIFREQ